MSIPADRLVAEALNKSGLLWLTSPAGSSPVWHAAADGVAYVVTGPGEQPCPPHVGDVDVVVRAKESRARLADFRATVSVLDPADDDWERATFALRARRLNAPAGDLVARWREHNTILRLVPALDTVVVRGRVLDAPPSPEAPSSEPDAAGAPAPATATVPASSEKRAPERSAHAAPAANTPAAEAARDEFDHAVRAETATPWPSPAPRSDESGESGDAVRVAP